MFGEKLKAIKLQSRPTWISMDGVPVQEEANMPSVKEILSTEEAVPLSCLKFRDPAKFIAGGLHDNTLLWEEILRGHPRAESILKWIGCKVGVEEFLRPFKGVFKRVAYDSESPPAKVFRNHTSCKKFSGFVTETILKRVEMGAVEMWGEVETVRPPHLVLPLTVEPSKPRLCLDARFCNLWMKDCPFKLDKLSDVVRYVEKDSYMTKCDDKSGYDHVMLQVKSQEYFGFQWAGYWFVCKTLPFGWKESPFVYHTIGLSVSSYLRSLGVPCSLYIDDRLNGELLTSSGPWSRPSSQRSQKFRRAAAACAVALVMSVLVRLGYTIGLSKSVLVPTQQLEYLGFLVDSCKECFSIPERKIQGFATLREEILSCKHSVQARTLQRFQGKCVSFSLAVPAAKLYIRDISRAIASCNDDGLVKLTERVRLEISHWRYLDDWKGFVPWRKENHVRISVSTDASGFGWGGVVHDTRGDRSLRDYWGEKEKSLNIATKEMLAIVKVLQSCDATVRDCRVDAQVDSQVVVDAFYGEGSRHSPQLNDATKTLFESLSSRNIQLELSHIASKDNPADGPSRRLSVLDSTLSPVAWERVEKAFGGPGGHSCDLMALDSNAQLDQAGRTLPHFTPFPSMGSMGVNLFAQDLSAFGKALANPYVFPPFCLRSTVSHDFTLPR